MHNKSLALILALALLALSSPPAHATFPGRNGRISFTGMAHNDSDPNYNPNDGTDTEIWTIRPDGTRERNITDDDVSQGGAIWSPSGRRLLYVCDQSGTYSAAVCKMRADGTHRKKLTGTRVGNYPTSWSPSGKHLLFVRSGGQESDFDIWRMRADGTHQRKLTEGTGDEREARWSPDGHRIVFTGTQHGNQELYLMRPDGTRIRRLTDNGRQDSSADWAPGGHRLVFLRSRGEFSYDIWTMRIKRRRGRLIRDDLLGPNGPVWSPNGRKIAFADGGNYAIYVMDPDGSNRRRVTSSMREDLFPSWQPKR